MCSLAASSFRVEDGETHDRSGDQPSPNRLGDQPSPRGGGDHRRRAACTATRPHPWCALPVLPDREVRVLAAGQPAAPGRLSRLPAVDADALLAAGIATAGVTRGLLLCHWLCRIASGTVIAAQGALRARRPWLTRRGSGTSSPGPVFPRTGMVLLSADQRLPPAGPEIHLTLSADFSGA